MAPYELMRNYFGNKRNDSLLRIFFHNLWKKIRSFTRIVSFSELASGLPASSQKVAKISMDIPSQASPLMQELMGIAGTQASADDSMRIRGVRRQRTTNDLLIHSKIEFAEKDLSENVRNLVVKHHKDAKTADNKFRLEVCEALEQEMEIVNANTVQVYKDSYFKVIGPLILSSQVLAAFQLSKSAFHQRDKNGPLIAKHRKLAQTILSKHWRSFEKLLFNVVSVK